MWVISVIKFFFVDNVNVAGCQPARVEARLRQDLFFSFIPSTVFSSSTRRCGGWSGRCNLQRQSSWHARGRGCHQSKIYINFVVYKILSCAYLVIQNRGRDIALVREREAAYCCDPEAAAAALLRSTRAHAGSRVDRALSKTITSLILPWIFTCSSSNSKRVKISSQYVIGLISNTLSSSVN